MKFKTVCIIDDDPIFVYGTKILMNVNSSFCSNILVYEDGKEALTNLSSIIRSGEKCPEVIFLDLNMPIMNGWQFLDEFIKLDIKDKPTIFIVSSSIDSRDFEKAKEYEIVKDFIVKPLSQPILESLFH